MWTDEIVEETRKTREEYAAKFNYDLEAIYRDLVKQQEQSPDEFVSLPSKSTGLRGKYRGQGLMKELLAEKETRTRTLKRPLAGDESKHLSCRLLL